MTTAHQAIEALNQPLIEGEPALAGQVLLAALGAAGITDAAFRATGEGIALAVPVPREGEVWIANFDATVHYPAADHTGWLALHHEDPEDPQEDIAQEVYESEGGDCAADSEACAQAVADWLARQ